MKSTKFINRSQRFRHLCGLTMIELMVTLSVLVILTSLAAPSFIQTIASTRLSSATNELLATLTLAKSEAIKRGVRITVCPSTDGATCTTNTNWANGWIVFNDITRVTNPVVDAGDGETVLQVGQNLNDAITIRSLASARYVSFGPDGASKLISGAFSNNTVRVCSTSTSLSNATRARDISIQRSGRIDVSTPASVASTCPAPP
jgi:type IV fimbrial biogenesis protein FimT